MAIPWLIGAAAVGVATWLLSDSKEEKQEKEREEKRRIRKEAREDINRAKQAEERRQQEAQARDLEQFAYVKGKSLADKYGIEVTDKALDLKSNSTFSQSLANLAIHNTEECKKEFKRIFLQSSKSLNDMNAQKTAFESELQELDLLSELLVKMDK